MKTVCRFTDGEAAKQLLWLTDIHLDGALKDELEEFYEVLQGVKADAVLVTGDICNGHAFVGYLEEIHSLVKAPVYFVLGNHDFYGSYIAETRVVAGNIPSDQIHYLTGNGVISLTDTTALIGHDGWADGRQGNLLTSSIVLWDYALIKDLSKLSKPDLLKTLNRLGDQAALILRPLLAQALREYERVVILTHPPPYKESCLYANHECDDNWGPHFVCCALGDLFIELAENHPTKQLLVLCGHTHHWADVQILPNLHVIAGDSELGFPTLQGEILI